MFGLIKKVLGPPQLEDILAKISAGQPTQIMTFWDEEAFAFRVGYLRFWTRSFTFPRLTVAVFEPADPENSRKGLIILTGEYEQQCKFYADKGGNIRLKRYRRGASFADFPGAARTNFVPPGLAGQTDSLTDFVNDIRSGEYVLSCFLRY
jgi:hypothetical protein